MAHFCKPQISPGVGYDFAVDVKPKEKVAPGEVWRMQVPLGQTRQIALWGGQGLWIKSNNPGVVPNNGFSERLSGDVRLFTLFGRSPGTSMLEAGQGGLTWASVQVQVEAGASTAGFVRVKGEEMPGIKIDGHGRVWRLELHQGDTAVVALAGGGDLNVVSNNPFVADVGPDRRKGQLRLFPVIACHVGDAMIEASIPTPLVDAPAVVSHLQVHVFPPSPNVGKVAWGPEAARQAYALLHADFPQARSITIHTMYGPLRVTVGQLWKIGGHNRFIVQANELEVYYIDISDNSLYRILSPDFGREIYLDAFAEGVMRAEAAVTLYRSIVEVIIGIFVPTPITAGATVGEGILWICSHTDQIERAMQTDVFRKLSNFKQRCPTTYAIIFEAVLRSIPAAFVEAFAETVTKPENIGFFIGRVIRDCLGKGKLTDMTIDLVFEDVPKLTFKAFAKHVVVCAVLVTGFHFPEGSYDAYERAKKENEMVIEAFASKLMIGLSPGQADVIAKEIDAYGKDNLDTLNAALEAYAQLFEEFLFGMRDLRR